MVNEEFLKAYANRNPVGYAPVGRILLGDCPNFFVQTTGAGLALGLYFGGIAYAWEQRKNYTTLLEDLSQPKTKHTTVKMSRFGFIAKRSLLLSSSILKGGLQGALFGASSCYFRKEGGLTDRTAVFLSGLVLTGTGALLWKNSRTWLQCGLVFTALSTALTFSNEFMMISDAHVTEVQSARARKRVENRKEFIKDCLDNNTLYQSQYVKNHPEANYKFY